MKSITLSAVSVVAVLGIAALSFAQPHQGAMELSFAASFMSVKWEGSRESSDLFNGAIRFGYFVTQDFEIEPELIVTFVEGEDDAYVLGANLVANFPSRATGNRLVPYFLVGGGVSNAFPFFQTFTLGRLREDITYGVLNVGAGVKSFVTSSVALRLEYRYQHFFGGEKTYYYGPDYSFTNDELDVNLHNVFMGVSVFLK